MAVKQIAIQTESGETVDAVAAGFGPDVITITRIGWRKLEEAGAANSKAALLNLKEIGGPRFIKEVQDVQKELQKKKDEEEVDDPLVQYDKHHLLTLGVKSVQPAGEAERAATIADCDAFEPETAVAVARAILRLSRPALFETKAERKND